MEILKVHTTKIDIINNCSYITNYIISTLSKLNDNIKLVDINIDKLYNL